MRISLSVLVFLAASVIAVGQDMDESQWKIMPGISVVKFFPGDNIRSRGDVIIAIYPTPEPFYYYRSTYAGTGLNFTARCFNEDLKPFALTFGGGVTWYYAPEREFAAVPVASPFGIGEALHHDEFTAFPLSLGIQAVFPYASRDRLMAFAGVEGNLQLISGRVEMRRQAQAGFTLLGGVAVKFLEFGVRYTSFSDIKNLGAFFGLRFRSFGV